MKNTQEPVKRLSNSAVISDSSRWKDCLIEDFVVVGDHCIIGYNTIIPSRGDYRILLSATIVWFNQVLS
jgi:UDP-3-O-[3-hydroxymyristoyl] glucosamine N-acyltransferase